MPVRALLFSKPRIGTAYIVSKYSNGDNVKYVKSPNSIALQ